jgi:hypothetical protein
VAEWCEVCCTRHLLHTECPGELRATGAERHGWRINVETPQGIEAYGVLIAPSRELWRARILTYPNILWLVPGGRSTLKFVGATARDAERQAVHFIRTHCAAHGYRMRTEVAVVAPGEFDLEAQQKPHGVPALRKIRFLPVRFGVAGATEPGGTGNLSESGLFIITNLPLDEGASLKMKLMLDYRDVAMDGLVRWMRRDPFVGRSPGMGVQLAEPPSVYIQYVRQLT